MNDTTANVGNTNTAPVENTSIESSVEDTTVATATDGTVDENNTTSESSTDVGEGEQTSEAFSWDTAKLPDGVTLTDEQKSYLDEWSGKIKNQGDLIDFVMDITKKGQADVDANKAKEAEATAQKDKDSFNNLVQKWQKELKSDADFGKDYDSNVNKVNGLINKFGGQEMAKMLTDLGFKDEPNLNKFMLKIANEFEDAKIITGNKTNSSDMVRRDRLGNPTLTFNNSFGDK